MTRIGLALAMALFVGSVGVRASHAQEPTQTPVATQTVAGTQTAGSATPTGQATAAAASPTPFNTPVPGELIAPAPQPTSPSVIAPQTGFGSGGSGETRLWIWLVSIGALGVIAGTAGIASRLVATRARHR